MNTLAQESVPLPSTSYDIPQDYRKRAEWFLGEYGETMNYHLENLLRFCGHLNKGQAISFSDITPEGFVHAHYGPYSLYFPIDKVTSKITPIDWMKQYILEIDNQVVPIDSGMQEIPSSGDNTTMQTRTTKSKIIDTLLPGVVHESENKRPGRTSRETLIRRVIRIRPKNMVIS